MNKARYSNIPLTIYIPCPTSQLASLYKYSMGIVALFRSSLLSVIGSLKQTNLLKLLNTEAGKSLSNCVSIITVTFAPPKNLPFLKIFSILSCITFYIREANDFYYMRNPPPYVQDIQDSIEKILRKGRFLGGAKVTVIMDTQLLNDIPSSVFNNFNKFVCFRLPITDSRLLLNKATIPIEYLYKLASCDVGQGMYIVNGMFEYLALFIPTLHQKADPEFDVFAYLSSIYGIKDYAETDFLSDIEKQEQAPLLMQEILK